MRQPNLGLSLSMNSLVVESQHMGLIYTIVPGSSYKGFTATADKCSVLLKPYIEGVFGISDSVTCSPGFPIDNFGKEEIHSFCQEGIVNISVNGPNGFGLNLGEDKTGGFGKVVTKRTGAYLYEFTVLGSEGQVVATETVNAEPTRFLNKTLGANKLLTQVLKAMERSVTSKPRGVARNAQKLADTIEDLLEFVTSQTHKDALVELLEVAKNTHTKEDTLDAGNEMCSTADALFCIMLDYCYHNKPTKQPKGTKANNLKTSSIFGS